MTLTELAERVERLTGPCRETDREILFATFPKERTAIFDGVKHISTMTGRDGEFWFNPLADRVDCPYYTEDFNDAMELLPANHRWLMNGPDVDGAGDDIRPCAAVIPYGVSLFLPSDTHQAATPVLAFLSAVLRARAASESSHG